MENLMCKLEGMLNDYRLAEAENLYHEFKETLPKEVEVAFKLELHKKQLEKSAITRHCTMYENQDYRKQFYSLFKHVG